MSIKIYLSSFDLNVLLKYKEMRPEAELNVLLSYGTVKGDYYDMIVTHRDKINSLILDSGAFTYNYAKESLREKIDLDGFACYCQTFNNQFDFIFNFDKNFKATGYDDNCKCQKQLEEKGIKNLVPVVHDYRGLNTDEVGEYLKNYEIISLGMSEDKKDDFVVGGIVKRIKDAGKKVHLLGVSSYNRLKDLPIDYNDSSNWAQAQKFGYVYFWNYPYNPDKAEIMLRFRDSEPDREDNKLIYFEDYDYRPEVEQYIKNELSITYRDLYGHNATFCRQLVNTHYFVTLQDHVRAAHKANGFDTIYP
ncbi:hypothetical protein GTA51_13055 [Desulfovibrio aerotolerans]|uniref:Uncharacterized protein n=1 Tax=Solidesulfovibrio aerotolerans TaxID=295255 RepID=A0A7C9N1G2_9BACT|nr:hypothetical protein [Solidesulfovibrio aerotolerans]MYL84057.1 hypothetical protein [Solidesulfovibrio aerotolerans]